MATRIGVQKLEPRYGRLRIFHGLPTLLRGAQVPCWTEAREGVFREADQGARSASISLTILRVVRVVHHHD
jgi:hypothetical protein